MFHVILVSGPSLSAETQKPGLCSGLSEIQTRLYTGLCSGAELMKTSTLLGAHNFQSLLRELLYNIH